MENKFIKYFLYETPEDWHESKNGVYHITSINCGIGDGSVASWSGPCLKRALSEYGKAFEKKGVFEIGNILHEKAQEMRKLKNNTIVIEFPVIFKYCKQCKKILSKNIQLCPKSKNHRVLTAKGSVDILDLGEFADVTNDIKTSSQWTHPSSEYDYDRRYSNQVTLYTAILKNIVFRPAYFQPEDMLITYVRKTDLETNEIVIKYKNPQAKKKLDEFIERMVAYDDALLSRLTDNPIDLPAEPNKYCKYCPILKKCEKEGHIKKDGKFYRLVGEYEE